MSDQFSQHQNHESNKSPVEHNQAFLLQEIKLSEYIGGLLSCRSYFNQRAFYEIKINKNQPYHNSLGNSFLLTGCFGTKNTIVVDEEEDGAIASRPRRRLSFVLSAQAQHRFGNTADCL